MTALTPFDDFSPVLLDKYLSGDESPAERATVERWFDTLNATKNYLEITAKATNQISQ
jgi:anti-sigma factor RsiW